MDSVIQNYVKFLVFFWCQFASKTFLHQRLGHVFFLNQDSLPGDGEGPRQRFRTLRPIPTKNEKDLENSLKSKCLTWTKKTYYMNLNILYKV